MSDENNTILEKTLGFSWRKGALLGALLASAVLVVYGRLLSLPFFQDDFFLLRLTQRVPMDQLWRFFHINPMVVYFRPLSMQLYYFVIQTLFGIDPLPFRLVGFSVHILNAFLVWRLLFVLSRRFMMSWVGALLYATSMMHFIALAWISEFSILLGTTAVLGILLLFTTGTRKSWLLSILLFELGLLIHEIIIVTPVILFLYGFVWRRLPFSTMVKRLLPYGGIGLVYLWLRFLVVPPPLTGTYTQSFSGETIKVLVWYATWIFQIPEEFRAQTLQVLPFELNALFVSGFFFEVVSLLLLFLIVISFLLLFPLAIVLWKGSDREKRDVLRAAVFGGGWFGVGILPFIFMPKHAYPLYGAVASIGVFLLAVLVFSTFFIVARRQFQWRGLMFGLIIGSWLVMSIVTVRLSFATHWTIQVARRSARVVQPFQRLLPKLPRGSIIVLPDDTQLRNALLEEAAFQAIYGPGVETYYGLPPVPPACAGIHGMVDARCLRQHHIYVMSREGLVL